jgi:hypothetical protein
MKPMERMMMRTCLIRNFKKSEMPTLSSNRHLSIKLQVSRRVSKKLKNSLLHTPLLSIFLMKTNNMLRIS